MPFYSPTLAGLGTMRPRLVIFFTLFLQLLLVSAGLVNRTIDDTYGDIVTKVMVEYTDNWNVEPGCTGCGVQPESSQAYFGTWHDTTTNVPNKTEPHSATLKFNGTCHWLSSSAKCTSWQRTRHIGTAVWIYCILVNSAGPEITIFTNITFEVDGVLAGTYHHIPDSAQAQYLYNVSVFQKTDMSQQEHVLVMSAMQGSEPSLLLFDYAVYT